MGYAILSGALDHHLLDASTTTIAEPSAEARERLAKLNPALRLAPTAAEALALTQSDAAFVLCIKPQMLDDVAREITPLVSPASNHHSRRIISILAGTPLARLHTLFDTPHARHDIARAMPNLALRIGKGVSALAIDPITNTTARAASSGGVEHAPPSSAPSSAPRSASPSARTIARALLGINHQLVVDLDESLLDPFTALAGSGPAYLFLLAEAMRDAAIKQGLPKDQADAITRATLSGSAELLFQSQESPESLRAAVTSKGGTTAAAIDTMLCAHLPSTIHAAIAAATARAKEIARS
ncbi:MAG: hypothetical protein IPK69_13735 [Phycisphaerales bacterium]|nr:MAG: hypothetical protein IPK69_13735 [Phycisphaerales bacterium]